MPSRFRSIPSWSLALGASAVFWPALIVMTHRQSPRATLSAHGFLHSAIAQRFQVDGAIVPPQDPLFAGEPLPYYWTFHALGAAIGSALELDPLHSFELAIALAAVALVGACAALCRSLYGSAALGAATAFLVMVGANLQAPLVLAVRWSTSRGALFADDGAYLWGLVHPLLGRMRLWDPFSTLGPLLSFYLNVTARPLALSALAFMLLGLERALSRGWRGTPTLVVSTAVCTGLGPLIGLPGACALAGALLVLRLPAFARVVGDHQPPLLPAVCALGLGSALGMTSMTHLIGGAGGPALSLAAPDIVFERILGMLAAGWPLIALAVLAARSADGALRHFLCALLLASLALAGATALLELPAGNYVNFFHAALVLLAVCATGALRGPLGRPSPRRIAGVVAAFTPVLALIVLSYTQRPPIPLGFEARHLVRTDATHLARLYRWIRSATPPDAVFVVDPGPPIRAMAGNTSELPALTQRTLFTGRSDHYIVSGHPTSARRGAIARKLLAGAALDEPDARLLGDLSRPLYLVVDGAVRYARRDALDVRYGRAEFRSGPVAAWRWTKAQSLRALPPEAGTADALELPVARAPLR